MFRFFHRLIACIRRKFSQYRKSPQLKIRQTYSRLKETDETVKKMSISPQVLFYGEISIFTGGIFEILLSPLVAIRSLDIHRTRRRNNHVTTTLCRHDFSYPDM